MNKILIIGGGAAGLSAAATAAEAGAVVTVLEKRYVAQGNGRYAEGVFGAGSYLQRRRNIDADPEKLFRYAMEFSHWRADPRLTRRLIAASGETVDWLTGLGVPFSRLLHHMPNQCPEVFHMAYPAPTGTHVMRALENRCRDLGVDIRLHARARRLLVENGIVTGAVYEAEDGTSIELRADCVLIATGGFAGNPELMRDMIPNVQPEAFMHLRGIPMEGDGLQIAKEAGAGIVRDIAIEGCGPVFGGRPEINVLGRDPKCVWVSRAGYRFCDETISNDFVFGQNAVARLPGKMCWALVDGRLVEDCRQGLPGLMADLDTTDNGMAELSQALEKAVAKGQVFQADSLEELALKMGMDPETLTQEIGQYNADCAAGADSLFGKDRRYMQPLEQAPFYGIKMGMDMLTTHGGIGIDSHMRVLDPEGRPIPGLYAAGIDTSGVDSGDYCVMLSGHAFGFSLTGGRIAAREMLTSVR